MQWMREVKPHKNLHDTSQMRLCPKKAYSCQIPHKIKSHLMHEASPWKRILQLVLVGGSLRKYQMDHVNNLNKKTKNNISDTIRKNVLTENKNMLR